MAFATLTLFSYQRVFPTWPAEERVALYSIIGGIPAYLEWLDSSLQFVENLREIILSPGSMFMAEPAFLLYDELHEPDTYLSILRAISNGHHTLSEISKATLIERTSLSAFLRRLQDLRLVERRLPAILTTSQRRTSKRGRYHLTDPYFRFYFRFLIPHQRSLMRPQETLIHIQNELRSFVGIGFETLAQEWVIHQSRKLPFIPESVGSHWSRHVQIDVLAINWHTKDVLLGECKWGGSKVDISVTRDLIEQKGPRLRDELPKQGQGWTLHYAIFTRSGFTSTALRQLQSHNGLAIDLQKLDADLSN